MKRTVPLIALLLVVIASPFARAEGSLSDAQLNAIRTNCVDAQISLQHLQANDRLTRINRGSRYESILKLMSSFNSRVVENKLDASNLIGIANDYQKTWESFRSEYTAYYDAMTTLIEVDCKTEPTTFNDKLVELRQKRTGLNARVNQFEALLDKYQTGVNTVKDSLEKS